jgi:hypothetical protein
MRFFASRADVGLILVAATQRFRAPVSGRQPPHLLGPVVKVPEWTYDLSLR